MAKGNSTPDPLLIKSCPTCGSLYPQTQEYFIVRQRHPGGGCTLGGQCKDCYRRRQRVYHAAHRDHENAEHRQWRTAHKEEINARQRTKYAENPVPRRERNRRRRLLYPLAKQIEGQQYRATARGKEVARTAFARRKARKLGLPCTFTTDDWKYTLEYWYYTCAICGAQDGLLHMLAQEHWIALSHPHSPGTVATNMLPLCDGTFGCNQRKGKKDGWTFLVERLGPRKAKAKLREIDAYFAAVRARGRP